MITKILSYLLCTDGGFAWMFFLPIMHFLNPIFAPIIHPIFWLAGFMVVMKKKPYLLNSSDGKKKSKARAFWFVFLFYYLAMLSLILLARYIFCSMQ